MGYGYGYNANGRECLACDSCGTVGGVRKRRCTFKVLTDSLRSKDRFLIDYCPAPALCGPCLKKEGGIRKVHAGCEVGAGMAQTRYDAIQKLLDEGKHLLTSASGDWHEEVPEGMVRATFNANNYSDEQHRLIPQEEYEEFRKLEISTMESHDAAKFLQDHVVIIPVGFPVKEAS